MNAITVSTPPITGIILAGGRASRMNGQDKGLIELRGRPLIAYVIERLRPQVANLRLNANRHLEDYRAFGYPVFTDAKQDYQGPLSGMLRALQICETEWVLCVPCDTPLLPMDLATRLRQAITEDARLAVAYDGKRMQPTFCLLHCSLMQELHDYLEQGGRKVGAWLQQHKAVKVDFSDQQQAFININTSEELENVIPLIEAVSG